MLLLIKPGKNRTMNKWMINIYQALCIIRNSHPRLIRKKELRKNRTNVIKIIFSALLILLIIRAGRLALFIVRCCIKIVFFKDTLYLFL